MRNKYEIVAIFANDFGKAFDFVRKEVITECIEIVRAEVDAIIGGDDRASVRQRMIERMKKLGPVE